MEPKDNIEDDSTLETVVGIFKDQSEASRVAASIRSPELDMQRVSRRNHTATDEMPDIVYDPIEEVPTNSVLKGMLQGGAIGAGSGLLLLGIPIANVVAPIGAALAGAFIGAVAGVDESVRGIELPNLEDYKRMLADGKSIIVVSGSEVERIKVENQMKELGAIETHQHPPVRQAVRDPSKE